MIAWGLSSHNVALGQRVFKGGCVRSPGVSATEADAQDVSLEAVVLGDGQISAQGPSAKEPWPKSDRLRRQSFMTTLSNKANARQVTS